MYVHPWCVIAVLFGIWLAMLYWSIATTIRREQKRIDMFEALSADFIRTMEEIIAERRRLDSEYLALARALQMERRCNIALRINLDFGEALLNPN